MIPQPACHQNSNGTSNLLWDQSYIMVVMFILLSLKHCEPLLTNRVISMRQLPTSLSNSSDIVLHALMKKLGTMPQTWFFNSTLILHTSIITSPGSQLGCISSLAACHNCSYQYCSMAKSISYALLSNMPQPQRLRLSWVPCSSIPKMAFQSAQRYREWATLNHQLQYIVTTPPTQALLITPSKSNIPVPSTCDIIFWFIKYNKDIMTSIGTLVRKILVTTSPSTIRRHTTSNYAHITFTPRNPHYTCPEHYLLVFCKGVLNPNAVIYQDTNYNSCFRDSVPEQKWHGCRT